MEDTSEISMFRLPTHRPVLTYVLLTVIISIFVLQAVYAQINFPRPEPITAWGALNYARVVFAGEHYRLFTAMFLHAGEVHLLFNGLALWVFGRTVESVFGTARFALIYFLGGLTGSLASLFFTRGLSVGASGAIFAIFGAEMVFLYRNRALLGSAAREQLQSLITLALLNFGLGIFTQIAPTAISIDNWAHGGGFLGGVILTWLIGAHYRLKPDTSLFFSVRLVDDGRLSKTWYFAALYAAGLAFLTVYVLNVLSG
ncbi:MAG: rhomboid family intramembrane serine protease [Anaerolineae bacterium]|nr:rhomboid family intramembrane serine protease [Anaerolineae bacterium]MDW8298634.1 rhomboid family intramembrane serine protease [Anaerolineae bacterium]